MREVGPIVLQQLLVVGDDQQAHLAVADLGDALRLDASQVLELARYVEQKAREYGLEDVRVVKLPGAAPSWKRWPASAPKSPGSRPRPSPKRCKPCGSPTC